jgi:hypothetical protein
MGAVLVVPDLADRTYIKELVQILLVEMGFKQVAVHQVWSFYRYRTSISLFAGGRQCQLWSSNEQRMRGRRGCCKDQHLLY